MKTELISRRLRHRRCAQRCLIKDIRCKCWKQWGHSKKDMGQNGQTLARNVNMDGEDCPDHQQLATRTQPTATSHPVLFISEVRIRQKASVTQVWILTQSLGIPALRNLNEDWCCVELPCVTRHWQTLRIVHDAGILPTVSHFSGLSVTGSKAPRQQGHILMLGLARRQRLNNKFKIKNRSK
jgi:hypothetical protein